MSPSQPRVMSQLRVKSILFILSQKNILIARENIAEYRLSLQFATGYFDNSLSSIATRQRVASFLNFVPIDLETRITVEGSCLQNFITHKEINDNITVTVEVAWLCGWGAELVMQRSWVQIFRSQIQHLHVLLIANWLASCQLGFLASFCLIYRYCYM